MRSHRKFKLRCPIAFFCEQKLVNIYITSRVKGRVNILISITSAEVGMKINEWHRHIQKFNVTDAEMLKAEIERDIEVMEEDQDLLIYYQLMAFRHKIMLEYTMPSDENRMELSEYLKRKSKGIRRS